MSQSQICKLLFALLFTCSFQHNLSVHAQIIGSSNPGESLPKEIKPYDISGNAYQGDVDLFTGSYNINYPLGAVTTPGGLNYTLNMSYSSSHVTGNTPPHIDGIPYGVGWSLNIPTISVQHEFKAPYGSAEYNTYMNVDKNNEHSSKHGNRLKGNYDDGNLFWRAPTVNIPGVYNGRVVLKQLENGNKTPVFIPFKFEKYFELRLQGTAWVLTLDDGTTYEFGLAKKSYRKGLNKRAYSYKNNDLTQINNEPDYAQTSSLAQSIKNAQLLPKGEYTQWYCTRITNKNMASFQGIRFDYETFGKYNYFRQFEEEYDKALAILLVKNLLYNKETLPKRDKLGNIIYDDNNQPVMEVVHVGPGHSLKDMEVFTDVFLKQIVSYEYFSDIDKIKLNYRTKRFAQEHQMLEKGTSGVHVRDSLNLYTSVYYQGKHAPVANHIFDPNNDRNFYSSSSSSSQFFPVSTGNTHAFSGWRRYLHRMHNKVQNELNLAEIEGSQKVSQNPYVAYSSRFASNPPNYYVYENASPYTHGLKFDHGFLESGKINLANNIVPGDVYEIRSLVSGTSTGGGAPNASKDLFLFDINIKAESDEATSHGLGNSLKAISQGEYDFASRNIPIFTTFDQGIKWATYNMITGSYPDANSRATSNFFTMPYINNASHLKIQVGPANSDNDLIGQNMNLRTIDGENIFASGNSTNPAYKTYPSVRFNANSAGVNIKASQDIPHHFGLGLPWFQTRKIYQDIVSASDGAPNIYDFWWNIVDQNHALPNKYPWKNEPTLAGDGVKLEAIELIRHSKNTYLLDNVEVLKLNGESNGTTDPGWTIVKKLQFEHDNKVIQTVPFFVHAKSLSNNTCSSYTDYVFGPTLYRVPIGYKDSTNFSPLNNGINGASSIFSNVIVLKSIKQLPIRPWDNKSSFTTQEIATAPTTHFTYSPFGIDTGDVSTYGNVSSYASRLKAFEMRAWKKTFLITGITSHLGGETEIVYHKYVDPETHYINNSGDFGNPLNAYRTFNTAAQVTNPVKSIRKKSGNSTWQKTDYEYKGLTRIKDIGSFVKQNMKRGPWQLGFKLDVRSGFRKVKVLQPELNGLRPYALHYFNNHTTPFITPDSVPVHYIYYCKEIGKDLNGNPIWAKDSVNYPPISEATNFLYGKLEKTENYDASNNILSANAFHYEVTKAYESAMIRPYNHKFNGVKTDYFDYLTHKSSPQKLDSTYKNQINIQLGNFSPLTSPKFLEQPKFVEHDSLGHDAYFIKKVKDVQTEYSYGNCYYEPMATIRPGFINPILTDQFILGRIKNKEIKEVDIKSELLRSVPHSDAILKAVIDRSPEYSNDLVKTIMKAQPDLSDATLITLLRSGSKYAIDTKKSAFLSMPYAIADSIIDSLSTGRLALDSRSIEEIVNFNKTLPKRSNYTAPTNLEQSYTNRASTEKDAQYLDQIKNTNEGFDDLTNLLIENSPLSDAVLLAVIAKEGWPTAKREQIINKQPDLSDETLLSMINHVGHFSAVGIMGAFKNVPHIISDKVMLHLVDSYGKFHPNVIAQLFIDHPFLSQQVTQALLDNMSGMHKYLSQNFYNSVFTNSHHLTESVLKNCVTISNTEYRFSGTTLKSIFEAQSTYPSANVLTTFAQHWKKYGEENMLQILTHKKAKITPGIIDIIRTDKIISAEKLDQLEAHYYGDGGTYMYSCSATIGKSDRLAIHNITEYEYYEANPDGTTTSNGYRVLLNKWTGNIQLPFEPSWQLYSTRTYSPQYPGAYVQKENYYYYDLHNRYNPVEKINIDAYSKKKILAIDTIKNDTTYGSANFYDQSQLAYVNYGNTYPDANKLTGAKLSKKKGLRNIPYQVRTLSKNNRERHPQEQSQYFVYHSDWNIPFDAEKKVVKFTGPACPPPSTDPNIDPYIKKGCSWFKYPVGQLPYGYVVYYTQVPVQQPLYYKCPCGVVPVTAHDSMAPVMANPVGLLDMVRQGQCVESLNVKQGGQVLFSEFAFKDLLAFSEQHIQLDSIPTLSYDSLFKAKNIPQPKVRLLEFLPTTIQNADSVKAIFPYDHMKQYKVVEMNRLGQPQLTSNENDLYTKYYYDRPYFISYEDDNCHKNNYSAVVNTNIGVPTRVVEGAAYTIKNGANTIVIDGGEPDSLVTQFDYNIDYSLDSIVDPNGGILSYKYDDNGRMEKAYRNGDMISKHQYSTWSNNTGQNFSSRTTENYVESYLFNEAGSQQAERARAWIDPMGRKHHTATQVTPNAATNAAGTDMVHSGIVTYDAWNRPTATNKSFVYTGNSIPFAIRTQTNNLQKWPNTTSYTAYENDQRSRPLKEAPFGHTLNNTHNKRYEYNFVNGVCMACEIGLSNWGTPYDEYKEMMPGNIADYIFKRTTTYDEDGKMTKEYINALGQKVATYQENGYNDAITLFLYNNGGQVRKVINPVKQQSIYDYNLMGWLYRKQTPDAGRERFMYNKSGSLQISFDENNKNTVDTLLSADTTLPTKGILYNYRYIDYDKFNRPVTQARYYFNHQDNTNYFRWELMEDQLQTTNPNPQWNSTYFKFVPSHSQGYSFLSSIWQHIYTTAGGKSKVDRGRKKKPFDHQNLVLEKEWIYSTMKYNKQWTGLEQSALFYVTADMVSKINNARGQLVATMSYDNLTGPKATHNYTGQNPIELSLYSYNINGQPEWLLRQFEPTGIKASARGHLSRITYPEYNLRGSLKTQNIDINADGKLDMQYHYTYDGYNRLRKVYTNLTNAKADGNLVAEYEYDDAYGLLTKTTYRKNCKNTLVALPNDDFEVDVIQYKYDKRDRLNLINSKFFDYKLFYDSATVNNQIAHKNYNGNINGIKATYKLAGFTNTPASGFNHPTWYGYQYDGLNRLTNADAHLPDMITSNAQTKKIGDATYEYFRSGNFSSLTRHKPGLTTDFFPYAYQAGTNRLTQITGTNGAPARNYQYDAAGNLTYDSYRQLNSFKYGRANLPFKLKRGLSKIDYLYDINDARIYKNTNEMGHIEYYLRDASGKEVGVLSFTDKLWTWYIFGDNRFAKSKPHMYLQPGFKGVSTSKAPKFDEWTTHYNAKLDNLSFYVFDHLGNTRLNYNVLVENCTKVNNIPQARIKYTLNYAGDYFPYGKVLREFSSTPKEKYITTHHERDQETGLDYRGARVYDTDIARFLSLDPLAVKYPTVSDYMYVLGNPVILVDPDGQKVIYSGKGARRAVRRAKRRDPQFKAAFKALKRDKDNVFEFNLINTSNPDVVAGAENTFDPAKVIDENGNYNPKPNIGFSPDRNMDAQKNLVRLNFRERKSETKYIVGGQAGYNVLFGIKTPEEISKSSKHKYSSGTITVTGGSNDDSGQDRLKIVGSKGQVLMNVLLPDDQTTQTFTVKFKINNKLGRSRLRFIISNDERNVSPGAFGVKIKIDGN